MLLIPVSYLKQAKADYAGEMLAVAGYSPCGLPPLVMGCLPLFELADCRWYIEPCRTDELEIAKTLYIIQRREKAVNEVAMYEGGDHAPLESSALRFLSENESMFALGMADILRLVISAPLAGFSLLPRGGDSAGEWWFSGEWIGSIVQTACKIGMGTAFEVMWRIPLAQIGFALSAYAKSEGMKGVGRKEDEAETERMIAEAEEREKRGELHPWQIAEPHKYSPSEEQIKANPSIMAEYERLLNVCQR